MNFMTKNLYRYLTKMLFVLLAVGGIIAFIISIIYFYQRISTPTKLVDLEGEWKISYEDNPDYSKQFFDDTNWTSIKLPGNLIKSPANFENKYKGICWIRKTFSIENTEINTGIILGRIANADETFINGIKIGATGDFPPNEFARWNYTRNYSVPDNLIEKSEGNVIAVRVSFNQIGEIQGSLGITSRKNCMEYGSAFNFIEVTSGYITIGIGLSIIIIFSLFYIKNPEVEEYFYYCLQLAAGLPVVLEVCIGINIYPSQAFRSKLLVLSWILLNVAHPIFLHRIYNLNRKKIELALWIYGLISFISCMVITTDSEYRFYGQFLIIITWTIGFYNFSCHISALIKKRPYAKLFCFFGMVVVIGALHDGMIYFIKYSSFQLEILNTPYSVMFFHVGAFFLYFGTSVVLVYRFLDIANAVIDLNSSLENYIIENSCLSEKLDQTLKQNNNPMSQRAEEKIKDVIRIIDEHYLSGLDRLGLAKSVGVHPDNLSKHFKKFTGKKLGDYIYELRINEAAKRLRETDDNIIDIAFAVGFESLRTFNRIFPKIMGITPVKYRKQNMEK